MRGPHPARTLTQGTVLSLQAGPLGPRGGGFSHHVFCPRQQFSGLREGRPNPCERREVRTLTGTHLSPATWPLGCRAASSDLGRSSRQGGAEGRRIEGHR